MKPEQLFFCIIFFTSLTFSVVGQNDKNDLIGTIWLNEIVPDVCYDSLEFKTDSTAIYYSCEMTYSYKATYEQEDNRIEILISDSNLAPDLEPTSKWILNLVNSELEYSYIGQRSFDGFREVDQKTYKEIGKFKKITN